MTKYGALAAYIPLKGAVRPILIGSVETGVVEVLEVVGEVGEVDVLVVAEVVGATEVDVEVEVGTVDVGTVAEVVDVWVVVVLLVPDEQPAKIRAVTMIRDTITTDNFFIVSSSFLINFAIFARPT